MDGELKRKIEAAVRDGVPAKRIDYQLGVSREDVLEADGIGDPKPLPPHANASDDGGQEVNRRRPSEPEGETLERKAGRVSEESVADLVLPPVPPRPPADADEPQRRDPPRPRTGDIRNGDPPRRSGNSWVEVLFGLAVTAAVLAAKWGWACILPGQACDDSPLWHLGWATLIGIIAALLLTLWRNRRA